MPNGIVGPDDSTEAHLYFSTRIQSRMPDPDIRRATEELLRGRPLIGSSFNVALSWMPGMPGSGPAWGWIIVQSTVPGAKYKFMVAIAAFDTGELGTLGVPGLGLLAPLPGKATTATPSGTEWKLFNCRVKLVQPAHA